MSHILCITMTKHILDVLLSGVHCTAPVLNGVPSSGGHPHPRGSYSPLPHIHLGNGLGPSWPSDVPQYSFPPREAAVRPAGSGQLQGELNESTALNGCNLRGTLTDKECRNWVEKTNQAMQGSVNYFTKSFM